MALPLRLFAALCFITTTAFAEEPTSPSGASGTRSADTTDLAAIDAAWAQRDVEPHTKELADRIAKAVAEDGKNYDVLWRASRYSWWLADGTKDKTQKRDFAKQGRDYATAAIALKPDGIEGNYYLSANIGAYSLAVGVFRALTEGLEGKFRAGLDYVVKTKPEYHRHGASLALGRYYFSLPWPKRNYKKSIDELTKVLNASPDNLRARLYRAETLLAEGEKELFHTELEKIFTTEQTYDPPEARRVRAMAEELAKEKNVTLKK